MPGMDKIQQASGSGEGKIHAYIWTGFGKTKFLLKYTTDLTVDGTKPEFVWKNHHYTLDLGYCSKLDKNRLPILDYEKDHSIPIRLSIAKDELPEKDDSAVFNQIFNLGILRAIIAAATKLSAQNPIWIQLIAGIGIGFILAVVLGHFGVLGNLTSPGGSGVSVGGAH